jgi:hypothetical protein
MGAKISQNHMTRSDGKKIIYSLTVTGAPDRIKLRTPILLRFQYDSAAAGQLQTTGA